MNHDPSRRHFLTIVVAAAGAPVALSGLDAPAATPAASPPLPKLSLNDPAAKALGYSENAATVKHSAFKAGSQCANCNLYRGAKGQAYGPCTIFPKNTVSAKGWCSAWATKL